MSDEIKYVYVEKRFWSTIVVLILINIGGAFSGLAPLIAMLFILTIALIGLLPQKIFILSDHIIVKTLLFDKKVTFADIVQISEAKHPKVQKKLTSIFLANGKRIFLPVSCPYEEIIGILLDLMHKQGRETIELDSITELKMPDSDHFRYKPANFVFYNLLILFGFTIIVFSCFYNAYGLYHGGILLILGVFMWSRSITSIALTKSGVLVKRKFSEQLIVYDKINEISPTMLVYESSKVLVLVGPRWDSSSFRQNLRRIHYYPYTTEIKKGASSFSKVYTWELFKRGLILGSAYILFCLSLIPLSLMICGLYNFDLPELWKNKEEPTSSLQYIEVMYDNNTETILSAIEEVEISDLQYESLENYISGKPDENKIDLDELLRIYAEKLNLFMSIADLKPVLKKVEVSELKESINYGAISDVSFINLFLVRKDLDKGNTSQALKRIVVNLKVADYLSSVDYFAGRGIYLRTVRVVHSLAEKGQIDNSFISTFLRSHSEFRNDNSALKSNFILHCYKNYDELIEMIAKRKNGGRISPLLGNYFKSLIGVKEREQYLEKVRRITSLLDNYFEKKSRQQAIEFVNVNLDGKSLFKMLGPNFADWLVIVCYSIELKYSLKMEFRSRPQIEATPLYLAICMYQNDHGKIPAILDDLMPNYIKNIPRDYFTGYKSPIKYRVFEDGKWQLENDKSVLRNFDNSFFKIDINNPNVFWEK